MDAVNEAEVKRFTLADIPYQRGIAAALGRALAEGRLAHAYLFGGPRGVGKEAVAYALGAAALCPEAPGAGCGVCNTCRRVFADLHPDFVRYQVEAAHFPIGDPKKFADEVGANVRKIIVEAGRPPSEAPRKVLLVVEPEKMTYHGDAPANAFLKTLEEPPGRTTFVLASHDPRQLLPTILSRCVTVHFPRLTAAEIEAALVRDYGVAPAEAAAAAARADGTLSAGAAAAGGEDAAALEYALAVLEEIAAGGVAEALAAAQATRGREDAIALVNALAEVNHDLAALRAGAAETLRFPAWEGRCRALVEGGRLATPERLWEVLSGAALALRDNCNVALTLEELFLGMLP